MSNPTDRYDAILEGRAPARSYCPKCGAYIAPGRRYDGCPSPSCNQDDREEDNR